MALGGIGGLSGFDAARAAALYNQNTTGKGNAAAPANQARMESAKMTTAAKPTATRQPAPETKAAAAGDATANQKTSPSKASANSAVYDPRDKNQDHLVSVQEELVHAAKQYTETGRDTQQVARQEDRGGSTNGVNGREPRGNSINLKI